MWFVILTTVLFAQVLGEIDLVVQTTEGPVKGQRASEGDYTTFLGISYARVDETNPFGASLPPYFLKPDHEFQANDSSIICPQKGFGGFTGQLDCLRLNIYVPKVASDANPVPVFVWFHGGLYAFGSGGMYGGKYLVKHGIIVVTVNYRLGPYGFLCLNHPSVPGNQGLKDQITALRWIKQNIEHFGGNPNNVTIGGESAGGGSVDLHLYSNYETLFNKVIIESGSSFVQGMFVKPDHDAAKKLAKELGYETMSTVSALRFLISSKPSDVSNAFSKLQFELELRPCQEVVYKNVDSFVTDDPYHLQSKRIKDMVILTGYNSKEEFGRYANETEEFFKLHQKHFYDTIAEAYNIDSYELKKIAHTAKQFYMGSRNISKATALEYIDFSGDFMMNRASEKSVDKYMSLGAKKIYKYLFSYVGGSRFKEFPGVGASHMEELKYLFDLEQEPLRTDEEKLMSDRMITMWANFIKYDDPTPQTSSLLSVKWTPINDNSSRPYLNIDVTMAMGDNVFNERMAFWELFESAYWRNSVLIQRRKWIF